MLIKQLIKFFGFPMHTAPGEAEAECALLQREGIVDAVLSEDVDTLMFGCSQTLRNWSSEGSRGNKSPTHVNVYNSKATKEGKSGLDREGMILVALMSGGDYITEGIPGCGIKVACEAARASFGKTLCQLSRSDATGLDKWRANLSHEILTNESKYFRVKHKTFKIPDTFPNKEVLGYYTHPVVSSAFKLAKLKEEISWDGEIDVQGLRRFVAEAFEWTDKVGAKKFIRGLAPVLLVHKLRLRGDRRSSGYGDVVFTAMNEMELVRSICGQRKHISTDGIPELRVIFHPLEIVGIDLDAEYDNSEDFGRDGLAPLLEDNEIEHYESDDATPAPSGSSQRRAPSIYDPTQPDKVWIPESIAKIGIPLKVEDYEESLRNSKKFKAKATAKRVTAKAGGKPTARGGMLQGTIEPFVSISKPSIKEKTSKAPAPSSAPSLPPVYPAPELEKRPSSQPTFNTNTSTVRFSRSTRSSTRVNTESTITKPRMTRLKTKGKVAGALSPKPNANPWTLAQQSTSTQAPPLITKPLRRKSKTPSPPYFKHIFDHDLNSSTLSSLPSSPPSTSPITRKHSSSRSENFQDQEAILESLSSDPVFPESPSKRNSSSPPLRKRRPNLSEIDPTFSDLLPESRGLSTPQLANRRIEFGVHTSNEASPSSPQLPALFIRSAGEEAHRERTTPKDIISISSSPLPSISALTQSALPEDPEGLNEAREELNEEGIEAEKNGGSQLEGDVHKKRFILLRESLPGAWREARREELIEGRSRAWKQSEVDVLDLTES
ncbi:hypothetical protein B7494_g5436 [Chlorociboria aeruginascens]|nr:hypothetical protein B7494_g5436 [Chlorociboria aeruginascens]